ncbi:MAG TPA: hypothetical protein DCM38_05315 [Gammaproteobacteria bacterium]|nr:hypothetical protein [Gammaproteobacteria bacterium]
MNKGVFNALINTDLYYSITQRLQALVIQTFRYQLSIISYQFFARVLARKNFSVEISSRLKLFNQYLNILNILL